MELLEFKNKLFTLCGVDKVSDISGVLFDKVTSNDVEFYDSYEKTIDGTKDWLQALWQYYQADRSEKKQDYTPKTLCKLIAKLSGKADSFYDCCGGSGALSLEYYKECKAKDIFIEELDESVIPFLLFNLCLNNVSGTVVCGDSLTKKYKTAYNLTATDKYSRCLECAMHLNAPHIEYYNVAISNPPFNIKWQPQTEIEAMISGVYPVIPPASNANYAFVFNCLSVADKATMILPNGVMSQDNEMEIRQYLVDNDLLEAVITLPNHMFEATDISTCILMLNKNKANKGRICFIDLRKHGTIEKREQNGQFGGKAHTNRTYVKEFNILTDETIESVINAIKNGENIPEFSACVENEALKEQDYMFVPSRYIAFETKEDEHRPYKDIVKNLNVLVRQRNSCKLVINETLAKELGFDIDLYKQAKENSRKTAEAVKKVCGEDLIFDDYITFTKNKNEICFKSNDKELLSHLFVFFLQSWKQDIYLVNQLENTYLAELRDAMLPDLMAGDSEKLKGVCNEA